MLCPHPRGKKAVVFRVEKEGILPAGKNTLSSTLPSLANYTPKRKLKK
jgi:hypothetical protein